MARGRCSRQVVALVALAAALTAAGAACSGGDDDGGDATATSDPRSTSTTTPPDRSATVVRETVVSPGYRQGVARVEDGWVFSLNNALFRTDDQLRETVTLTPAVPAEFASRGFDHVGDIDVVDDVLYAPLEQPEYERGTQIMATYDAETLEYQNAVQVEQAHNAWVTVDPDTGIAYSMDEFGDQAILRYDTRDDWKPLPALKMSAFVDRVQGGDMVDGAIWLSTDDETDGVYRVDLRSGQVDPLGSIGRIDGEGEGIDATPMPRGDLHVLTADAAIVPVRLIDLRVEEG